MRLLSLWVGDRSVLAAEESAGRYLDLSSADPSLGTDVGALIASGADWRERAEAARARATPVDTEAVRFRPVIPRPAKLLCLGLNDIDHAHEAGLPVPEFPVVFTRVASSLIGHGEPMLAPPESDTLDYEVELAVIIGKGGRRIAEAHALDHVAGYTVFNDGSIREAQIRTHQWTLGKNYHGTGALGPAMVTVDELPAGASGLRMTTRVGDELLQDGNTGAMIFDVARTIALLSEAVLFEPGDVIAMGTPSGVGHARDPARYLQPGETCRAAVEQIGEIINPVVADKASTSAESSDDKASRPHPTKEVSP